MQVTCGARTVVKKKVGQEPERGGGAMLRSSQEFANVLRATAAFKGMSIAEYLDAHLLPVLQKQYREAVLKEARRIEGGGE